MYKKTFLFQFSFYLTWWPKITKTEIKINKKNYIDMEKLLKTTKLQKLLLKLEWKWKIYK